jgi:hypothetical protein
MEFEEKVKLLKKARAYWIWGLILTPLFPVSFVLRYLAVRLVAKVINDDEISGSYGFGLLFCFIPFLSIPLVIRSLREVGDELDNYGLSGAARLYSFCAWVLVGAAVVYIFGWSVRSEAIPGWSALIGLLGFVLLLLGLVVEAQGVWHLHEVSHKTLEKTSRSGVKREYNWVGVDDPWLLIASPTGLFIIFLFIGILITGLGDSEILQGWAVEIGIVGIVLGGFLTWKVAEREEGLRKRKMLEDYERRCRRWGKYWGLPGLVLLVLDRLKEKEGKEIWEKEEIIKAVKERIKKSSLWKKIGSDLFERLSERETRRMRRRLIRQIQDALNELVIEGILVQWVDLQKKEIYRFSAEKFISPKEFISPSEDMILEERLDETWKDLSGQW